MVGMDSIPLSSKNETWPMLANHTGDGEPQFNRVLQKTIVLSEDQSFHTQNPGCVNGVFL